MSAPVFGPIKTGLQLENEAKATIQKWINTYLHEIERNNELDMDSLPRPRSYIVMNEFDTWPEDQLPCILLISTGIMDEPMKRGGGDVSATWGLGVAVVVLGQSRSNARRNAQLYTAAIREVMIHKMTESGFANVCEWMGDSYDDLDDEQSRNLSAGRSIFRVIVDQVSNKWTSPSEPDPEPTPVYDPGDPIFNDGPEIIVQYIEREEDLT